LGVQFYHCGNEGGGSAAMRALVITAFAGLCVGCARRDPQPIATVQPTDANTTCAMISAQIGEQLKVQELAGEEGASGMNTSVYSIVFAQQHRRSGIEE
jgi:type IV pilus biogenesis protein CpaD/CtpE